MASCQRDAVSGLRPPRREDGCREYCCRFDLWLLLPPVGFGPTAYCRWNACAHLGGGSSPAPGGQVLVPLTLLALDRPGPKADPRRESLPLIGCLPFRLAAVKAIPTIVCTSATCCLLAVLDKALVCTWARRFGRGLLHLFLRSQEYGAGGVLDWVLGLCCANIWM